MMGNDNRIFSYDDIDCKSEEDLTISIKELDESIINDIINYINDVGYVPIKIGIDGEKLVVIDKFEDLNHHYQYPNNIDMFQDVKIHIHKTAVILPVPSEGGR